MTKYLIPVALTLFLTFIACQAVQNQFRAGETKIACEALSDLSFVEIYYEKGVCYFLNEHDEPVMLDLELINKLIGLYD